MICNILYPSTRFKQVYRNGMSERMDGAAGDTSSLGVNGEEILYLAFLHCVLPSGEEIRG